MKDQQLPRNQQLFNDAIVSSQAMQDFFNSNSLCCVYTQTSTQESNLSYEPNEQSSRNFDRFGFIYSFFERNQKLIIFLLNILMITILLFQFLDLLAEIFFRWFLNKK